ncbi:MAG: N-6 DNA methylase [Sphingopyxis sp.]|nr:N-6 DNA methylase [Sphingopyxis sp.]
METVDRWIQELGYDAVPGVTVRRSDGCDADQPFATEVRAMFDQDRGVAAAAFACIDRIPTIALIDRLELPEDGEAYHAALRGFCERLWNQNLARIVLVTRIDSFEAWSVDNPQAMPEPVDIANPGALETWSLSGILGGRVLKGREAWFDPERRVDKTLLESIQHLVGSMRSGRLISSGLARELIARVIFVSYLEDRRIVSDEYRAKRRVGWLYDLLGGQDVTGLDRLFAQLQKDFNGDFLKPMAAGDSLWSDLPSDIFELLHRFLGRTVMRSGQQDFWRYDFSEIPIELIAGIYETFLASKDDDALDTAIEDADLVRVLDPRHTPSARSKRKQGAYYTPRLLADAVVDMAFEGRDPVGQRIFDGACGSGMLLTAAFRHLIRTRQADAERTGLGEGAHGFRARCDMLRDQIFGADIDEDACRLTSFSLYLALLSDLAPRDLAVLRAGGHKLPSLAKNIRRGAVEGDFFSPESERANHARFTIFLSNPPWRKLREGDPAIGSVASWVERQGKQKPHVPSREIAAAFTLAASGCLTEGGRAALILPINLFLSTERTRREFRGDLLRRFRVERIVNFADMRYLLFADARHPFVVLLCEARAPAEPVSALIGEQFAYQTPKADIALAFGRLSLHDADTSTLPATALLDTVPQLALRYWGDAQDYQLLQKLWAHGKIGDLLRDHGWIAGKGFHLVDEDRRRPPETWSVPAPANFRDKLFLDAKQLARDLPVIDGRVLRPFPFDAIARVPEEERLFSGPRVLWPDGTNPAKGINAVYADAAFTFQHSLGVLAAPDDEVGRLTGRFITCYMRSTLGSWLSILLSASVSAERAKLHKSELADWPFWPIDRHPEPDRGWRVLREIDALLLSIETAEPFLSANRYEALRPALDELVFDYFGISDEARAVVRELAGIIGPSIQPAGLGYKSMVKPLRAQPGPQALERYANRLAHEMRRWRDSTGGMGQIRATTWTAKRAPLGAAVLEIVESEADAPVARIADDMVLQEISDALVRVSGRTDGSLFRIPNLTVLDGTRILIIKPLIMRYWLERSASADAAKIAVELQLIEAIDYSATADSDGRADRLRQPSA